MCRTTAEALSRRISFYYANGPGRAPTDIENIWQDKKTGKTAPTAVGD